MKKIFKLNLIFALIIICLQNFAQNNFKYNTTVENVKTDGIYKINLLPQIISKCNNNATTDLRLLDSKGKEVPYVIKEVETGFEQSKFREFKKIKEKVDSSTRMVFESESQIINNIVIVLKNSAANRSVNISGSNNLVQWYVIKEFINLEVAGNNNLLQSIQNIDLPPVNYKYFQITFNGTKQDPLYIEQVGNYNSSANFTKYFEVPSPQIFQKDSNKFTYVQLVSTENYTVNKLQLFVSGSKLYKRNLLFNNYYNDVLSSTSNNIYYNNFTDDTIRFVIENNDNPSLRIDSVKFYQTASALYTYLIKGENYKLVFGNNEIEKPVYDLNAFSDSFHANIPLLYTKNIIENTLVNNIKPVKDSSTIWLWAVMLCVLVLLIYFSSKLLKQVNKK